MPILLYTLLPFSGKEKTASAKGEKHEKMQKNVKKSKKRQKRQKRQKNADARRNCKKYSFHPAAVDITGMDVID